MTAIQTLVQAVIDGKEEEALLATKQVVQEGLAVDKVVEALTAGMREIGEQFARMEIFLPEMMMAAKAMKGVMKELEPELHKSATVLEGKGTVVIGTVEGDMHEIGKSIVAILRLEQDGHDALARDRQEHRGHPAPGAGFRGTRLGAQRQRPGLCAQG